MGRMLWKSDFHEMQLSVGTLGSTRLPKQKDSKIAQQTEDIQRSRKIALDNLFQFLQIP